MKRRLSDGAMGHPFRGHGQVRVGVLLDGRLEVQQRPRGMSRAHHGSLPRSANDVAQRAASVAHAFARLYHQIDHETSLTFLAPHARTQRAEVSGRLRGFGPEAGTVQPRKAKSNGRRFVS